MSDDSPFDAFGASTTTGGTDDLDAFSAAGEPSHTEEDDENQHNNETSSSASFDQDDDNEGGAADTQTSTSSSSNRSKQQSSSNRTDDDGDDDNDDPFGAVDGGSSSSSSSAQLKDDNENDEKNALWKPEEDDSALRAWEEERRQVLAERQLKADQAKQQLLTQAREDMQKFYSDLEQRVVKNQKQNRLDEKNFRADMKSLMEHGSRWEKVAKVVNLAPRPLEKGSQPRVERMRKLLLSLKTDKFEDRKQ